MTIGALALVRNLRNIEQAGVKPELVREAMGRVRASDVWPWQALAAAREAPAYTHDLDALALRSAGTMPRIPGETCLLVDVSGSMSRYSRTFLHFLHALAGADRRVHAFLFGTRLTDVTRALRRRDPRRYMPMPAARTA